MCKTKGCRKTAKKGNYCYSCVIKRFAIKHPEKYAYFTLRNNAKRRGKVFTITFDDFLAAIIPTKYMKGRGRTATSLHIDRDKEHLGYEPGNLKVRRNTDNIKKYLSWSHNEKGKPINFKFHTTENDSEETHPF